MTYKTKSRIKRLSAHAFEVCIGSTIYSVMSDTENKIINKLYTAIKNKTTYSYNVKLNKDEEQSYLVQIIIDEMKKGMNATGDTSGQYPPTKLVFYKKTPILLVSPKSYSMNRIEPPIKSLGIESKDDDTYQLAFKPRNPFRISSIDWGLFSLITFNTKKHKENLNKYIEILKKKAISLADVNKV